MTSSNAPRPHSPRLACTPGELRVAWRRVSVPASWWLPSSVVMSFEPSPQDDGQAGGKVGRQQAGPEVEERRSRQSASEGTSEGKAARKTTGADGGGEGPTGPLPERPARTVTPPTLTSAELDRLIKQFLTATAPKVEPATLTTDVEFVRRIYFDVIGHPPTPVQVESFLHDHSKDKRARLIDTLAGQPGIRPQLGQLLA